MKKFISLAVALAMMLSVCPLLAFAATETVTLFDATIIEKGNHHGDVDLADYGWSGNSGAAFSTQWSDGGVWSSSPYGDAALMFFRTGARGDKEPVETKTATFGNSELTKGATKLVFEYKFATQTADNDYQTWQFKDLDDKVFATVYYDKNVKATVGAKGGSEDGNLKYVGTGADVLALRGTTMKIEAVKGASNWTVTYTSKGTVVGTETVDSINGFKSIEATIPNWNDQYAAMALQGLKISADIDPSTVAKVTVKHTADEDTALNPFADKSFVIPAGEYTFPAPGTTYFGADGVYYVYDEESSNRTIVAELGKEHEITLNYKKHDGTGLTGSIIADGATCWFADPRTLTVKNDADGKNITYIGYIDNVGNVRATQYDNKTGEYEEVLVRSNLQPDDHNNPAFLELPDHHIMIIYSRHTDEACFYYRVSKQPYDITTLAEERRLATEYNTTYPNPFILESDPDHIYMGWRGVDWHPTFAQLEMPTEANGYTTSFTWGPQQIVRSNIQGASSTACRPYAKYASDGISKVWLTYTGTHPDNVDTNPIYCNYIDITDLTLHDAGGKQLQDLNKGRYTVSGSETETDTQVVYRENNVRGWVWEIALDENSLPVIAMVKIDGSKKKHDYWLAHYTGSAWEKTNLPDPDDNTFFHQTPGTENCYSGGMSIDKANTHDVYASVPVHGAFGKVWEIVKYTLNDDYSAVETTTEITKDSVKNNARPYVANGSAEGDLRLTWFNGDYYYWIHSNQHGGLGYPVQMMTITDMEAMPVNNTLDEGDGTVKSLLTENNELAAAPGNGSFTISLELLQNDIADEGALLESGDLKVELKKQTVDDTYNYAAVAPMITVGDRTEKSQNLFSDSAWYFSLGGTGGTKSQSSLGWINYVITYDAASRELVTYVNGLIDATMQDVDISLGDSITAPGGLPAVAANVRTAAAALTQAEVRDEAKDFDEEAAQAEAEKIFENFDYDLLTLPEEIATDLVLPAKTNGGSAIAWTSDNTDVIANNGAVTRDGEEHTVTLTASFGGKTKQFTVKVLARNDVYKENIVFHYDFNAVDGTTVPDVSGHGNDAEIKGSKAVVANGKLDLTANEPEGWDTNSYLNVPHDILAGVRSYTVAQKISGGKNIDDTRLYDFGKAGSDSMFTRLNTRSGANQYQAGLKYNNGSAQMIGGGPIASGEYWLVTTYDAVSKTTKVYVADANGLKKMAEGTNITHEPYEISGTIDRNFIGRSQWYADKNNRGDNDDFNGSIDDFMFFNTALTEDEINGLIPEPASADEITAALGWNGEDFTIDFDLGTSGGDTVKVYKNGNDEVPVASVSTENGTTGVSFFTKDTNALYKAAASSAGKEGAKTAAVSVYSLVADAIAGFAKDTQISEAQLDKAIEVINAGGIYIKDGELTTETKKLMDYKNGVITLNDAAYNAGLRFKSVKGYAIDAGETKTDMTVSDDGRTVTLGMAVAEAESVMLEEIEFTFDDEIVEEISDDFGEIEFIEEI